MREKYFQNEFAEMWIENGIFHVVHAPYVTVNGEVAKINIAKRLEISDGKTYPMFVDARKGKTMTKEAKKLLSEGDGIRGISAGAFLVRTQIEAFLLNAWIKFDPPGDLPTKLFGDKDKALAWLEFYKRLN